MNSDRKKGISPPPPRSIYRKIRCVLEEARKRKSDSLEELAEKVFKGGYLDFTYYKPVPRGKAKLSPCKLESIERTVNICAEIGLIKINKDETCELTTRGLRATDPSHFDQALREGLNERLKILEIALTLILEAIMHILIETKWKTVPTWDVIYEEIKPPADKLKRDEFRVYLSLLSACQGIGFCRKKIYLP